MSDRTWDDAIPLVIDALLNGEDERGVEDCTGRDNKVLELLEELGFVERHYRRYWQWKRCGGAR